MKSNFLIQIVDHKLVKFQIVKGVIFRVLNSNNLRVNTYRQEHLITTIQQVKVELNQ